MKLDYIKIFKNNDSIDPFAMASWVANLTANVIIWNSVHNK